MKCLKAVSYAWYEAISVGMIDRDLIFAVYGFLVSPDDRLYCNRSNLSMVIVESEDHLSMVWHRFAHFASVARSCYGKVTFSVVAVLSVILTELTQNSNNKIKVQNF